MWAFFKDNILKFSTKLNRLRSINCSLNSSPKIIPRYFSKLAKMLNIVSFLYKEILRLSLNFRKLDMMLKNPKFMIKDKILFNHKMNKIN